jgi:hypothetical protein
VRKRGAPTTHIREATERHDLRICVDVVDGLLCLERAPFLTGEILHIDGGQAAGR